jgi:hypothetical protein
VAVAVLVITNRLTLRMTENTNRMTLQMTEQTTQMTLRMSQPTAHSEEWFKAVTAVLDAADAQLSHRNGMPPPGSFSDTRAVLWMRLIFDGEPVQVASAKHDASRGMLRSVSRHAGDAAVLFELRLNAEQEEAEDETQMSHCRKALDFSFAGYMSWWRGS